MQTDCEDTREKVCIGIPCFGSVPPEILEDYMRFAFYLGRFVPEYKFFLAIKGKAEQFRARNSIVEAALAYDCEWLLMLDDDHIIDIGKTIGPNDSYGFVSKLIQHLKDDPKRGVVGALYYARGGRCEPVLMNRVGSGFAFLSHGEVSNRLQKVDVTGGGCMAINMKVFDKIESPWFEPEFLYGTDIQICQKSEAMGFEVWCDTSIELGHLRREAEIVTSKNIDRLIEENHQWVNRGDIAHAPEMTASYMRAYTADVLRFTEKPLLELQTIALAYFDDHLPNFNPNNAEEYYRNLGVSQLARNFVFHSSDGMTDQGELLLELFNPAVPAHGQQFPPLEKRGTNHVHHLGAASGALPRQTGHPA